MLVAKGYTQTYQIDYKKTFPLVVKMITVRIILFLVVHFGWEIHQFDVKNALLRGILEEEVYMEIAPGYGVTYEGIRRTTTGYSIFLGGNLVTWRSKKQNVVARSSVEEEFRAMAKGICELLSMKIILNDLKVKYEAPMGLVCDKKSVIIIAHNPVQHDRTKNVEID
ncbi:uncharacterized protein [Phaseolus vulgaris]|uniref:uncharacterized protein n=1 Tax=Phaseolus vulgaris TaxID=3885 RepID=UPI0035C9AF27